MTIAVSVAARAHSSQSGNNQGDPPGSNHIEQEKGPASALVLSTSSDECVRPFLKIYTKDYAKCEWPEEVAGLEGQGGLQLAAWADALNNNQQGQLEQGQLEHLFSPAAAAGSSPPPPPPGQAVFGSGRDVISFSHFVPDQRLTPEKRFLSYPNLVRALGEVPASAGRHRSAAPFFHPFYWFPSK